jgi:hypothetical protein
MPPASALSPSPATEPEALGLAHVASASFVASRVAPTAPFWLALPGGVALARAGARLGLSRGYGASVAATLQGVAILGPLRVSGPLTQAMTAPLLGRLDARRAPVTAQVAACLLLRLVHYAVLTAFGIWLVLGGLDAFVRAYETTTGWLGFLPQGTTGALLVLVVTQVAQALFFSTVQVIVYRRALRRWPTDASAAAAPIEPAEAPAPAPAAHDPRALALAALFAFAVLLAGTAPALLAGVGAWLAVATLVARPRDGQVVRVGAALALLLALATLVGGLVGGLGAAHAAERAVRAALLVLVATWLRAAAGPEGMREVFAALLARLRRLGWAREAGDLLARLDSAARLAGAGRALLDALRDVRMRPVPVADATVAWVAAEASRGPGAAAARTGRRAGLRGRDRALVALALLPALGLLAGG